MAGFARLVAAGLLSSFVPLDFDKFNLLAGGPPSSSLAAKLAVALGVLPRFFGGSTAIGGCSTLDSTMSTVFRTLERVAGMVR
jgi:hypothetical protein